MLYLADAAGPEQCDGLCTSSSCLSGLRGFAYASLSIFGNACACYVDQSPTLDLPGECAYDDGLLAYRANFDGTGEVMNTISFPFTIECWKNVTKSKAKAAKTSSTQAQVGEGQVDPPAKVEVDEVAKQWAEGLKWKL